MRIIYEKTLTRFISHQYCNVLWFTSLTKFLFQITIVNIHFKNWHLNDFLVCVLKYIYVTIASLCSDILLNLLNLSLILTAICVLVTLKIIPSHAEIVIILYKPMHVKHHDLGNLYYFCQKWHVCIKYSMGSICRDLFQFNRWNCRGK